jgi:hypothetical protein
VTVSRLPPYTVTCNRCGAPGTKSDVSPGLARAAAKAWGWSVQPGPKQPIDWCAICTITPEETQPCPK